MQIGTQTNSLVNHLYARATVGQPKPVVGMGATLLDWTDRRPATITSVMEIGGSKVWRWEVLVTEDDYQVIKGSAHDGSAEYSFTTNTERQSQMFRFNKKADKWVSGYMSKATGRFCAGPGCIRIGSREKYVDPTF